MGVQRLVLWHTPDVAEHDQRFDADGQRQGAGEQLPFPVGKNG
jgi:hypothetical protein